MEAGNRNRLIMLTTTFSCLSFIYALLIILNNPSKGYELSIYSATPAIFWIAITIGLVNGIFLIVCSMFDSNKKMWLFGAFEIVFCNAIVISLYALRGYVLYLGRGDVTSYVGMAKDISIYGHIPDYNFYPMSSILISQISQLSYLQVIDISKYLPSLFFVLYVFFVYCWAKSMINDKYFILNVFIASAPIFFAWFTTSIYHQFLSVMILPLFFLCLQKNQNYGYRILCIVICVTYPFWHPIIAIIVCAYLMAWFLAERYCYNINIKKVSLTLVLISVTCLTLWFINQYLLLKSIRSIILQLVNLLQVPSTASQAGNIASKLGLMSAIKSLYLMINDEIIFYILSFISTIYITKQNIIIKKKLFPILMCFAIGTIILLVMFFSARIHTPDRLINLNFNMIFTPLMVGWLLYKLLLKKKKFLYILLIFLIFISAGTSIISLYPSPITMRPNDQVSYKEVKGMNWLISHKSIKLKTVDVLSPVRRYADLIYGYEIGRDRWDMIRDLILPDHFGINNQNLLPMDAERYLVITDFDVRAYAEVWENIHRFNRDDFYKVDLCTNVDKIYENSELRSYLVHQM